MADATHYKAVIEARNGSVEKLVDAIDTISTEIPNDDNTIGYIGIICYAIKKRIAERKAAEAELAKMEGGK